MGLQVDILVNIGKLKTMRICSMYLKTIYTKGKYCLIAFIWIVTLKDCIHRLKNWNHVVQRRKEYHGKSAAE